MIEFNAVNVLFMFCGGSSVIAVIGFVIYHCAIGFQQGWEQARQEKLSKRYR